MATFGYHAYLRCLNGECDGGGHVTPAVRSMKRKKAWPGVTTEQQKFNGPINDCSSRNVTDLFTANCESFLKEAWLLALQNSISGKL